MTKSSKPPVSAEEPPATPAAELEVSQTRDLRERRIDDYLDEVLHEDSPLAANVGAVNSDLMQTQYFLRQVMNNALAGVTPSLEELQTVLPGIDNMVKISKQIDRFTQLTLRIKMAEEEAERLKDPHPTDWGSSAGS